MNIFKVTGEGGVGGVFCNCEINIVQDTGGGGGGYFVTIRSVLFRLWVKKWKGGWEWGGGGIL